MAVVMPVKLELSSNELVLRPQGFSVKTCFMGTVGLYNHQNYFAKFEWQPVITQRGMAFSIRPAKGNSLSYLFDLDTHLFMCSGSTHLLSMNCIMVLKIEANQTWSLGHIYLHT